MGYSPFKCNPDWPQRTKPFRASLHCSWTGITARPFRFLCFFFFTISWIPHVMAKVTEIKVFSNVLDSHRSFESQDLTILWTEIHSYTIFSGVQFSSKYKKAFKQPVAFDSTISFLGVNPEGITPWYGQKRKHSDIVLWMHKLRNTLIT